MTKAELLEFLTSWNQENKTEGEFKPINPYQLHALSLGLGFYLKWYLKKEEFTAIAKELDYELEPGQENKIVLTYGEQNVELELLPEE